MRILLAVAAASVAMGQVAHAEEGTGTEPEVIVGNILVYQADEPDAIGYKVTADEDGSIIVGMSSGGFEVIRLNATGDVAIGLIGIDAPPDTSIGEGSLNIGTGGETVLGGRLLLGTDDPNERQVLSGGIDLDGAPHLAYRFEMEREGDQIKVRRAFGIYADGANEEITGRFLQEWQQRIGENGQLEYGGSLTTVLGSDANAAIAGGVFYSQRMGANGEWAPGAGFSAFANTLGDVDLTMSAEVLRRVDGLFQGLSFDIGPRFEVTDGGETNFTLRARVPFG